MIEPVNKIVSDTFMINLAGMFGWLEHIDRRRKGAITAHIDC